MRNVIKLKWEGESKNFKRPEKGSVKEKVSLLSEYIALTFYKNDRYTIPRQECENSELWLTATCMRSLLRGINLSVLVATEDEDGVKRYSVKFRCNINVTQGLAVH